MKIHLTRKYKVEKCMKYPSPYIFQSLCVCIIAALTYGNIRTIHFLRQPHIFLYRSSFNLYAAPYPEEMALYFSAHFHSPVDTTMEKSHDTRRESHSMKCTSLEIKASPSFMEVSNPTPFAIYECNYKDHLTTFIIFL